MVFCCGLLLWFDGALCECIEELLLHTQITLCCGCMGVLFVVCFCLHYFFLFFCLLYFLLFCFHSVARWSYYCSRARTVRVRFCKCASVCHEWARECFVCLYFYFFSFFFIVLFSQRSALLVLLLTLSCCKSAFCKCVCVCHELARECFVCFCFLFYSFLFYFFMCICI